MAHDVFVSYSNKDKSVADAVVAGLESRGIRCWIAPRDIKPGSPWGEVIVNAIEGSRIMVIILSGHSNSSGQVVREVERAVAKNVIIIPFRIENIDPTGAMAYFLSTEHWLDAITPPLGKHIQNLANTILVLQGQNEEKEIIDHPKGKGNQESFFQRVLRKARNISLEEKKFSDDPGMIDEYIEETKLKVINSLEVHGALTKGVIQFCVGDLTKTNPKDAVDVLVASAFRDSYYPMPGSIFGSLYHRGVSVEDLANNKEVDLRGAFSCWLSKEIMDPPPGINFKRLLCFEPDETAEAGELIGDIFRSLAPFLGGKHPVRSIATTLVAAGSSRRITPGESLNQLVESAVHWMSSGLPIDCLKIVCLPNQEVDELTNLFSELKTRYSSIAPQKQNQFSYDFFISYSHKDVREIDMFIEMLLGQNKELRIFLDKKNLNPGSAWQQEIYEAIDDCRKVTTFFSPTYLESKVCIEEFNIALCRHRESDEPILKPIYLYSANLPTYMRLVQFFDCRESSQEKLKQAANHLLLDVL